MMTLCVYILCNMLHKGRKISWITVGIALLAIVNGIASIIKVQALFPIHADSDLESYTFIIPYSIENMA